MLGGRLKLSNIGRGFLLNGVSPLGGLTPFWLGCRGYGQEHGGRCRSLRKEVEENKNQGLGTSEQQMDNAKEGQCHKNKVVSAWLD